MGSLVLSVLVLQLKIPPLSNSLACSSPVCISLYETITGSTDGEMPYHWYTDQRFSLFIVCLVIILPLSIPKEIGIQKYTRYAALGPSLWRTCGSYMVSLLSLLKRSVLGTLAATYLCVAVIVKYHLMDSHTTILTPERSHGSVAPCAFYF